MRDWFRYRDRFINIEKDIIYSTNTGNWSEVREMSAASWRPDVGNKYPRYWRFLALFILIAFYSVYSYNHIINAKYGIPMVIAVGFAIFKLKQIVSVTSSRQFKIPLDKIINFDYHGNIIELTYTNGMGKEDYCKITNVDEKGIDVMKNLIDRWSSFYNH